MVKSTQDLLRGNAEVTIGKYVTKGFNHSGVTGSRVPDRLNENGDKGITPQVMKENKMTVITKVSKPVKREIGLGMPLDSGKFKK